MTTYDPTDCKNCPMELDSCTSDDCKKHRKNIKHPIDPEIKAFVFDSLHNKQILHPKAESIDFEQYYKDDPPEDIDWEAKYHALDKRFSQLAEDYMESDTENTKLKNYIINQILGGASR